MPELLRGLDCFVLPSLAEGISNTILEAMASGLPVIATRVGGNAELVEDGTTGALVPAADSEALARGDAALRRAIRSSRGAHGRAGRARVERRFSLDAMVAQYHGALRPRCSHGRRGAHRRRRPAAAARDDGERLTMCGITGIFDTRGQARHRSRGARRA